MNIETEIERLSLANAVKYQGKANSGSVIGQLLGKHPEFRQKTKRIAPLVAQIIKKVNALSLTEQQTRLAKLAPELLQEKKAKPRELELKPLPGAVMGKVVTRTAPNPNGAIHLGNARAAVLSFLYAQKYKGKFILRYDDTSPKTKPPMPEAYKWVQEDLEWLGAKIDKIHYASKNFERYYEIAEKLIKGGKAYVCTCNNEEWRAKKEKGIACPCRDLEPKEHLERWHHMFTDYKEGEAVLRIKTGLKYKDPSRRDWWAAKVIENPHHPITKDKYRVWPSYNLQSAIDDHDLKVTHIIRGQEHSQNELRQRFIYDYLGWDYPIAIHHGRVILPTGGLSTSRTREMIAKGVYTGWDDPRLITIRALRRRGFLPEAIRDIEISVGLNTNDVILSQKKIASINRRYIDKIADRYMFVQDPVRVIIKHAPAVVARLKYHPDKAGTREITTNGEFLITARDYEQLVEGKLYRLMDCLNFKKQGNHFIFHSLRVEDYRRDGQAILHWVAASEAVPIRVLMPDGSIATGVGERALNSIKPGTIVQFNRFGFARMEAKGSFIFTHA